MSSDASSHEKYLRMVLAVDGSGKQAVEITLHEDKLEDVKTRMLRIRCKVNKLADVPSIYCLVCSAIAKERIMHEGGCPSIYNLCFKCLGQHQAQNCAGTWFKVAQRFCWKCWMPLFDICGVSFHSKQKEDIINCNNEARNFLKPLVMAFFYKRCIVDVSCPCGDISDYKRWLFSESATSVSGIGQMPNILLLMEAILDQLMTNVFM